MSQENVEILKHSFEEAPEDPEPFFAMFDEHVEWDTAQRSSQNSWPSEPVPKTSFGRSERSSNPSAS
jgi:hypothetical protein